MTIIKKHKYTKEQIEKYNSEVAQQQALINAFKDEDDHVFHITTLIALGLSCSDCIHLGDQDACNSLHKGPSLCFKFELRTSTDSFQPL